MKKRLLLLITLFAMLGVFIAVKSLPKDNAVLFASLEVLADDENGVAGHCKHQENACMWVCPYTDCGAIYEAYGYTGPSYGMSGTCQVCGR